MIVLIGYLQHICFIKQVHLSLYSPKSSYLYIYICVWFPIFKPQILKHWNPKEPQFLHVNTTKYWRPYIGAKTRILCKMLQKWYFWKDNWSCWFLQLIKPRAICSHKIGFCVNLRAPLSDYKETTVQQLHLNTTLTHHGMSLASLSQTFILVIQTFDSRFHCPMKVISWDIAGFRLNTYINQSRKELNIKVLHKLVSFMNLWDPKTCVWN